MTDFYVNLIYCKEAQRKKCLPNQSVKRLFFSERFVNGIQQVAYITCVNLFNSFSDKTSFNRSFRNNFPKNLWLDLFSSYFSFAAHLYKEICLRMAAFNDCYYRMCMMDFRPAAKWLAGEEDQKQLVKTTMKEPTRTLQQEQILKHQCLSRKKNKVSNTFDKSL